MVGKKGLEGLLEQFGGPDTPAQPGYGREEQPVEQVVEQTRRDAAKRQDPPGIT
jgi:hypothetical protein